MSTARDRLSPNAALALRTLGAIAAAAVLAGGFLAYLRPGFMVDLTNMVIAWCG